MPTTALDSVSNVEVFTLFVVLPLDEICTLRKLESGITVTDLKCQLELTTGLPVHVYHLVYPDGEILPDDKHLVIKKNVHDGYVIKVILNNEWDSLYRSVVKDNVEHVYHNEMCQATVEIDATSEDAKRSDSYPRDRSNIALFMASFLGHIRMCNMLLSIGADTNYRSPCGRTPLYAAVSKDHVTILELLVSHGGSLDTQDALGMTLSQIAIIFGSTQCSKKLRLMQLNLRGKSAHARASERIVSRPPRIPSEPIRRPQNIPAEAWRRPTTVHVSFPGVGRPETSGNFDHHNYISSPIPFLGERKYPSTGGFFAPSINEVYLDRAKQVSRGQEKKKPSNSENVLFGKQLTILRSKRVLKFGDDDTISYCSRSHTPKGCFTPIPSCNSLNKSAECLNDEHDNQTKSAVQDSGKKSPKYVRFSPKARSWSYLPQAHNSVTSQSIKRKIGIITGPPKMQVPRQTAYKYGTSHKVWLKKKSVTIKDNGNEDSTDEDSDSNDEENKEAFKKWLDDKTNGNSKNKRPMTITRPVHGVITIGSTEVGSAKQPDPTYNLRAYKEWLERRKKHGPKSHRMRTMQDFMTQKQKLEEKRQKLLMSAVSYDDWVEHTNEKQLLIRQILRADLDRLKQIEQEELHKRAKLHTKHTDESTQGSNREQQNNANRAMREKYIQEKEALRKEFLRYNASAPREVTSVKITIRN